MDDPANFCGVRRPILLRHRPGRKEHHYFCQGVVDHME